MHVTFAVPDRPFLTALYLGQEYLVWKISDVYLLASSWSPVSTVQLPASADPVCFSSTILTNFSLQTSISF